MLQNARFISLLFLKRLMTGNIHHNIHEDVTLEYQSDTGFMPDDQL